MMQMETKCRACELKIVHGSGYQETFELREDTKIFAGSSKSCGLQLPKGEVEEIHCLLFYSDEVVCVQPWASCVTLLNGVAVEDPTIVHPADVLTLGSASIIVGSYEEGVEPAIHNQVEPKLEPRQESEIQDESGQLDHPEPNESASASEEIASLPLEESNIADSQSEDKTSCNFSEFVMEEFDKFEEEKSEADLLQNEIELLQNKLEDRDRQIEDLQNSSAEVENSDDGKLENRLKELIKELESADARVLTLEELLSASEASISAEKDERLHLESWIEEIDQRFSSRENELVAEIESLQKQLDASTNQRDAVEGQLHHQLQSQTTSDDSQELVQGLQDRNADLVELVKDLRDKLNEYGGVEPANVVRSQEQIAAQNDRIQELEEKILQLEIDETKSRAVLAQERAQLANARDELAKHLRQAESLTETDSRFAEMRQHLRDVYEREQTERRESTLGKRITRLLKRSRG